VTNETERGQINGIEEANRAQMVNPVANPPGLNQQVVAQDITVLPSYMFKLSKARAGTTYLPLDLKTVCEAWTIMQQLGKPGEFQSTFYPSDLECHDAVDHVPQMQTEAINQYAVYARKYAVGYMDKN
jgi:hypothetical protein